MALDSNIGQLSLSGWAQEFADWVNSSTALLPLLLGWDPYDNRGVKKTAHSGSCFFDTASAVMAHMLEIGTSDRQQK